MSEDLAKLIDQTQNVLARGTAYRRAIEEIRYVLTGPVGNRIIRESVTKKPSKEVAELHRKIHDALVLLHDRERPPYPADYIVIDKLHGIFDGPSTESINNAGKK